MARNFGRNRRPHRRRPSAEALARTGAGGDRAAAAVPAGQPGQLFDRRSGLVRTGSLAGALHNIGGLVGAYMADLAFWFFGYVAYSVPFVLGGIAWIALFGLDTDGDGRVDFGPALRLIGIVGFLVSASGLLHLLGGASPNLPAESGGILGQLAGRSMHSIFGGMGGNLFLFTVFMLSVTLATGMSWFALMDWIGALVLNGVARFSGKRSRKPPSGSARAPCARSAKKCARSIPRSAPGASRCESSRRPRPSSRKATARKREQQIPLFNVGGDNALAAAVAARRSEAAAQGLFGRDPGDAVAADRIQAQGFPHRGASGRRLSGPGDHPLRAGAGAGRQGQPDFVRSTRTSPAACRSSRCAWST